MKIIGLTGGIGSGKSKAITFFKEKKIPCYQADVAGHRVLNQDPIIKKKLSSYFGSGIYVNGILDRKALGQLVFNNPEALDYLNGLVHPAVRKDFQKFMDQQDAPFVISEVAILFENEGQHRYDKIILITAPEPLRIERVLERDETSKNEVYLRIKKQWPDSKKIPLADYVIENIDWPETEKALRAVLSDLEDQYPAKET